MKDFQKHTSAIVGEILKDPEKYNLEGSYSDFSIDSVILRRFSHVARVTLAKKNKGTNVIYIKRSLVNLSLGDFAGDVRQQVLDEYRKTVNIYDHLRDNNGIFTPKPVGVFPEYLTIVVQECPGIPLGDVIEKCSKLWSNPRQKSILVTRLNEVGVALRKFHQRPESCDLPMFDLNKMVQYWKIRINKIMNNRKDLLCGLSEKILNYLQEGTKQIRPQDLKQTMAHCDFSPGNILVSEMGVSIIDFTRVKPWSKFVDITHLYHCIHMMSYKPFVDKKNIRTSLNSFLDGYCGKSLEDHILFKLFVIQNQLCHIAYLSSNPDRDLKGKLYTRYLAKESVKWLRRNLGE